MDLPLLRISRQRNHATKVLVTGFCHVFLVFLTFAHGVARQGLTPLWLSGALLRGQAAFCCSTHQTVDVRVVLTFWLLRGTLTCYHSGCIACEVRVDVFSLRWVHTQEWGCWPTWPLHVQPEELPDCSPPRLHHFTCPPPQRVPTPGASHRSPQRTLSECTDGGMQVSSHLPLLQWLNMFLEEEGQDEGLTRCGEGLARGHLGPGRLQPQTCLGGPSELLPTQGSVVGGGGQHMVSPGAPAQTGGRWPQGGPVTPGDTCRCAGRVGAGRGPARPGVEPGKLHCRATLRFPGTQAWELYTARGGGALQVACRLSGPGS